MPDRLKKSVLFGILAVVIYTVAFLAAAFPLILNLQESFLGSTSGYMDLPAEIWLHWYARRVLISGDSLVYTDLTNFPFGTNIFRDTGYFLVPLLGAIVSLLFSQAASYNVTAGILIVFSAYCGYLLVGFLLKDRIAGLLGGFIFGFSPYAIIQIFYGRLPEAFGAFVALFILFLIKTTDNRKSVFLPIAAGFLLLTTLASFTYGIFAVLFAIIFTLYRAIRLRPPGLDPAGLKKLGWLFLIYLVLMSPYAAAYLKGCRIPVLGRDSRALFPPAEIVKCRPEVHDGLSLEYPVGKIQEYTLTPKRLSLVAVALALSAVMFGGKRFRFWGLGAVIFYVLSLGTFLKIGGEVVSCSGRAIPLPAQILHLVFPFFSRVHWYYRFILFINISLAVLAGAGYQLLARKSRTGGRRQLLGVLIIIPLVMAEYKFWTVINIFPAPTLEAGAPEYYYRLAETPGDFAIIEYPYYQQIYLYYQTIHNKKIFAGQADLTQDYPDGYLDFVEQNSLLSFLQRTQKTRELDPEPVLPQSITQLADRGFKYLILHHGNGDEPYLRQANHVLEGLLPLEMDYPGLLSVYRLSDPTP